MVAIAQLCRNDVSLGGFPYFGMNLKIEIVEFRFQNLRNIHTDMINVKLAKKINRFVQHLYEKIEGQKGATFFTGISPYFPWLSFFHFLKKKFGSVSETENFLLTDYNQGIL